MDGEQEFKRIFYSQLFGPAATGPDVRIKYKNNFQETTNMAIVGTVNRHRVGQKRQKFIRVNYFPRGNFEAVN